MKRILYILCCCVSLLFLSCSKTAVVNDTISAYEEATKKVEAASNQDEYNSINDQLLAKLYTITQEYPDYQDVLTKQWLMMKSTKDYQRQLAPIVMLCPKRLV